MCDETSGFLGFYRQRSVMHADQLTCGELVTCGLPPSLLFRGEMTVGYPSPLGRCIDTASTHAQTAEWHKRHSNGPSAGRPPRHCRQDPSPSGRHPHATSELTSAPEGGQPANLLAPGPEALPGRITLLCTCGLAEAAEPTPEDQTDGTTEGAARCGWESRSQNIDGGREVRRGRDGRRPPLNHVLKT